MCHLQRLACDKRYLRSVALRRLAWVDQQRAELRRVAGEPGYDEAVGALDRIERRVRHVLENWT